MSPFFVWQMARMWMNVNAKKKQSHVFLGIAFFIHKPNGCANKQKRQRRKENGCKKEKAKHANRVSVSMRIVWKSEQFVNLWKNYIFMGLKKHDFLPCAKRSQVTWAQWEDDSKWLLPKTQRNNDDNDDDDDIKQTKNSFVKMSSAVHVSTLSVENMWNNIQSQVALLNRKDSIRWFG